LLFDSGRRFEIRSKSRVAFSTDRKASKTTVFPSIRRAVDASDALENRDSTRWTIEREADPIRHADS
jgi:hypothetical protein